MNDLTPQPTFTLEIEHKEGYALVRCHGRLLFGSNDQLFNPVRALMPETRRIVLDLTDLQHVDSTGLGTLVRLYVSASNAGTELQLINLGKQVRQLFALTHLLEVFSIIGEHTIKTG